MQILFDAGSMRALHAQRQDAATGIDAPLRWHLLVDHFATSYTGSPVKAHRTSDAIKPNRMLFTWHPSVDALGQALFGQVAYLCWGVGAMKPARRIFLSTLLRFSKHLLVNETTSEKEVTTLSGRRPLMVPMFIDYEYFGFKTAPEREDFLFCNGSNGRDPKLLVKIAEAGHRVIWLCNQPELIESYATSHPNLQIVTRISYSELRNLYQTCRAAIMPSVEDIHAAGQTTGLEALACGAPLIASAGRSATIFADLKSVKVLSSNSFDGWLAAIHDIGQLCDHTQDASDWVTRHCDKDRVMRILGQVLLNRTAPL
ncbi:hypothetical protein [Sulfitobacter sp.]|uniref:hypothetical protein n=1 Tax=Sulfitobacter sp. TaxID=1903071 RepID=UPI0035653A98